MLMRRVIRLWLLGGFLCAGASAADPSREPIATFLLEHGLTRSWGEYESTPRLPPARFLDEMFAATPLRRLRAGAESVTFVDRHGRAWKVAIAVAQALGLVDIPAEHRRLDRGEL